MATPLRAAASISGVEAYSRVPDYAKLSLLEKDAMRFSIALTKLKRRIRRVHNHEYKMQERRPRGRYTAVNNGGGYTATDESMVVDDGSIFTPGDTAYFPVEDELIQIGTVNGNTISNLRRGVGNSGTGAVIPDNAELIRVARNVPEGFTAGESYITGTSEITNYIEMISTPVEWTKDQLQEWSRISDDEKHSRQEADREAMAIEHVKECESALWFHKKDTSTSGGRTQFITDGFFNLVTTNVYNHPGPDPITEDEFVENLMEPCFMHGSTTEKYMWTPSRVLGIMEGWGKDYLRLEENLSQTLGFEVLYFRTTRGKLNIVYHPMFEVPVFRHACAITDLAYLRLALMQDTDYEEDIQNPKDRVKLDQWVTKLGLDMVYEECHAAGYGLNGT